MYKKLIFYPFLVALITSSLVFGPVIYILKNPAKHGDVFHNSYSRLMIRTFNNRFTYIFIKKILREDANVLLYVATHTDDSNQIKNIVEREGNINGKCNHMLFSIFFHIDVSYYCNSTPFEFSGQLAAINSNLRERYLENRETAKTLLRYGANINSSNPANIVYGWPIVAAQNADYEMIKLFLDSGLDVNPSELIKELMNHSLSRCNSEYLRDLDGLMIANGLNLTDDEFIANSKRIVILLEERGVENPNKTYVENRKKQYIQEIDNIHIPWLNAEDFIKAKIKRYIVRSSKIKANQDHDVELEKYQRLATKTRAQGLQSLEALKTQCLEAKTKKDISNIEKNLTIYSALIDEDKAVLNDKIAEIPDELKKTQTLLAAKRKLANEIMMNFKKAGIDGEVDLVSGDVTISFGQDYFETGRADLNVSMRNTLKKFISTYSMSLFKDEKIAQKISAVEIVGFSSPTYKGKYIDPRSVDPKYQAAVDYNMDLSVKRAKSISTYIFDKNEINYQYQDRLLSLVKVTGRSFLAEEIKGIASGVTQREFCKKHNCKKSQKIIIKFNLEDK